MDTQYLPELSLYSITERGVMFPDWDSSGKLVQVFYYTLFDLREYSTLHKEAPMKGMWSGDKGAKVDYRPALDAFRAVDSALLRDAVHSVVDSGAAITIAATRDGGAICLTLLNGNERPKVYCQDVSELNQALADLIDSFKPNTPPRKSTAK